jgi:hypothetical protein
MPAISLKDFPVDVRNYILNIQRETKNKKGLQKYSFYQIIFTIIREHKAQNQSKEILSPSEIVQRISTLMEELGFRVNENQS